MDREGILPAEFFRCGPHRLTNPQLASRFALESMDRAGRRRPGPDFRSVPRGSRASNDGPVPIVTKCLSIRSAESDQKNRCPSRHCCDNRVSHSTSSVGATATSGARHHHRASARTVPRSHLVTAT